MTCDACLWQKHAFNKLHNAALVGLIVVITSSYSFHPFIEVPSHVEYITVNPDQKTITWSAPAKTNGIIVGYRVQYWELGRRDTTEEVGRARDELEFS